MICDNSLLLCAWFRPSCISAPWMESFDFWVESNCSCSQKIIKWWFSKHKKKKKVHTCYRSCCVNKNFNLNNIILRIKRWNIQLLRDFIILIWEGVFLLYHKEYYREDTIIGFSKHPTLKIQLLSFQNIPFCFSILYIHTLNHKPQTINFAPLVYPVCFISWFFYL